MSDRLYRCYAKVNLTLEILARRPDGYHDLASVLHTVSLADELRITAADSLINHVEGLDIEPSANLVAHAARLLQTTAETRAGARLTLVKGIPAAAGLGGGSSDAASALVGLNRLWGARLNLTALRQLAAQLGSDVPFFVRGGAALMRGRGDELDPLVPLASQWLVLALLPHEVENKTRSLYAALQPGDFSEGLASERLAARLTGSGAASGRLSDDDLVNGFSRAAKAVFPHLEQTWAEAERLCGRRFHLSGAGPALFALAADRTDARSQVVALTAASIKAHAVRTMKHARASLAQANHLVPERMPGDDLPYTALADS